MNPITVLLVIILVVVVLYLYFYTPHSSDEMQTENFVTTDKYLQILNLERQMRRCMDGNYWAHPDWDATEMWEDCKQQVVAPLFQD